VAKVKFVPDPRAAKAIFGEGGLGANYLDTTVAERIVAYQKDHAPVETGRMRDSIVAVSGEEDGIATVSVGPTATEDGFPYPLVVELEEPFIRPSLDAGGE